MPHNPKGCTSYWAQTMPSKQSQLRSPRKEPFPCWAWYGLGLFADLPERDRAPFRKWLLRNSESLPQCERWPFLHLKLPDGFERHEDLFALKDHLHWELEAAFAKPPKSGLSCRLRKP